MNLHAVVQMKAVITLLIIAAHLITGQVTKSTKNAKYEPVKNAGSRKWKIRI